MIDRFFDAIADALGTNGCITLFAMIAFFPLIFQLPRTPLEWQGWLSQTALQLILLAVLQKGTKLEGKRNYNLMLDIHSDLMAELAILKRVAEAEGVNDGSE
jgi:hypothetical protein